MAAGRLSLDSLNLSDPKVALHGWKGSFDQYLAKIQENPQMVLATASQHLFRALCLHGTKEEIVRGKKKTRWLAFDDPVNSGANALHGHQMVIERLMNHIQSAAELSGSEKKILLFYGPPGGAKSTAIRLLREVLINYSKSDAGWYFTHSWVIPEDADKEDREFLRGLYGLVRGEKSHRCPIHEKPFGLLPGSVREGILNELNESPAVGLDGLPKEANEARDIITFRGKDCCPYCTMMIEALSQRHDGDVAAVLRRYVSVERMILSDTRRDGVATLNPRPPQDFSDTEVMGSINPVALMEHGRKSDPRVLEPEDGVIPAANQGLLELVEMFKIALKQLTSMLNLAEEGTVQPQGSSNLHIDTVVFAATNIPELKKFLGAAESQALKDRMEMIQFPYNTSIKAEVRVLTRRFSARQFNKGGSRHIAPLTTEIVAMLGVASRLDLPEGLGLSVKAGKIEKARLYDGEYSGKGNAEEIMKAIKQQAEKSVDADPETIEGMFGISPRVLMSVMSNASSSVKAGECITPFVVLDVLEKKISKDISLSQEKRQAYLSILADVKSALDEELKSHLMKAVTSDQDAIVNLFEMYLRNVTADDAARDSRNKEARVLNPVTGFEEPVDAELMRSIEDEIGIAPAGARDYRTNLLRMIGRSRGNFTHDSDQQLDSALKQVIFKDVGKHLDLTSMHRVPTNETEKAQYNKILEGFLSLGYCHECGPIGLHMAARALRATKKD